MKKIVYAGLCASTQNASQHSVHLTAGSLRVFKRFIWLGVDSDKIALSCHAHQQVTHTVGQFLAIHR